MGIKEEIGKRIKQLREEKGMSQANLCLDGEKLTKRQLVRIEKGESIPSLDKLEYIAKRLDYPLLALISADEIHIPDDYFILKQRLIKFPVYADPDRIAKKKAIIDRIYTRYMAILPDEELLAIDILEKINEQFVDDRLPDVEELYEDYFQQVLLKKDYDLNDLLLIAYYFYQAHDRQYDERVFKKLQKGLLRQKISHDELFNIELMGAISSILGVYILRKDYRHYRSLLDRMEGIMEELQLHSYKPIVLLFKAKYHRYELKDKQAARQYYDEALTLALGIGDAVLVENLKEERKRDDL